MVGGSSGGGVRVCVGGKEKLGRGGMGRWLALQQANASLGR